MPTLCEFQWVHEVSLRALLAQAELLWGGTSLGTGDLALLLRGAAAQPTLTAALNGGAAAALQACVAHTGGLALTYDGMLHLCTVLEERASRVRASMAAEAVARTQEEEVQQTEAAPKAMRNQSGTQHQPAGSLLEKLLSQMGPNSPTRMANRPTGFLLPEAAMPSGSSDDGAHRPALARAPAWWDGEVPGRNPTRSSLPLRPTSALLLVPPPDAQQAEPPGGDLLLESLHQRAATLLLPPGQPSRTHTAGCLVPITLEPHSAMEQPQAAHITIRPSATWAAPRTLQPPAFIGRLLQEQVRLPECEFATVRRLMAGVKALQLEGPKHAHLVLLELKEVVKAWEAALADKALKEAMKRSKKATGRAEEPDPPAPSAPQLQGEACVWVLLVTAGTLVVQGQLGAAKTTLDTAQEVHLKDGLGQDHAYWTTLQLCRGTVQYHEGLHEQAVGTWAEAAELGEVTWRVTRDPLVRRNAAACANNQGCALLHLGDRAGAVRCFKQAVEALRHVPYQAGLSLTTELQASQPTPPAAGAPPASAPAPASPASPALDPVTNAAAQPSVVVGASPPRPAAPSRAAGGGRAGKGAASAAKGAAAPAPAPMQGLDAPAAQVTMQNLQGAMRHVFALGAPPPCLFTARTTAYALRMGHRSASPNPSPARPSTAPPTQALSPDHPLAALRASRQGGARPQPLLIPTSSANEGGQLITPTGAPQGLQQAPGRATGGSSLKAQLPRHAATFAAAGATSTEGLQLLAPTPAQVQVQREGQEAQAWAARKDALAGFLVRAITMCPPSAPSAPPAYASRVTAAAMEGKGGKGKGGDKKGGDKKGGDKNKGAKKKDKGFKVTWPGEYYDPPIYSVANVKAEPPKKKKACKAEPLKKK